MQSSISYIHSYHLLSLHSKMFPPIRTIVATFAEALKTPGETKAIMCPVCRIDNWGTHTSTRSFSTGNFRSSSPDRSDKTAARSGLTFDYSLFHAAFHSARIVVNITYFIKAIVRTTLL